MTAAKKKEVFIVHGGLFLGDKDEKGRPKAARRGVHSLDAALADKLIKRGVAIEPGDEPEVQTVATLAAENTELKAKLGAAKAELEAAEKALAKAK